MSKTDVHIFKCRRLLLILLFLSLIISSIFFHFIYHKPKNRSLLIVGCARSGTTYISEVLQQTGLRIRHERMGKDGICSWPLTTWPAQERWGIRTARYHFSHIFHQVRDPLQSISSIYVTEDGESWAYILKHVPEIHISDSHLVKCAKYWYYWNLKAEAISEWTYKIEDLQDRWQEFSKRLGRPLSAIPTTIAKDTNSRQKDTRKYFTWSDLKKELDPELYHHIQQLAQKYGYPVNDPDC